MWYRIIQIKEWFGEMTERYRLVKDFNRSAKYAFIHGEAPTLLEAKITKGEYAFKHAFSKWMGGGFRIKVLAGRNMDRSELNEIGRIVIENEELTRKLITLGWDTLEVHSNRGYNGLKWALKKYAKIGGYLE